MEPLTHIHDLPDDILTRIFWHYEQRVPKKAASDALWESLSLSPAPKHISLNFSVETAIRPEKKTPLPTPPPSASAHRVLLISAVCHHWRRLSRRYISTLLVENNLAVSRQALASAVASLPNLTHLHLCDGSVETLDDAFLAHLASSCPRLAILHVGSRIAPGHSRSYVEAPRKGEHPITDAGLERFFLRSTQLEQLSLFCLHEDAELPASFFALAHLHTLALTNASPLGDSRIANLTSLTSLHVVSKYMPSQQVAGLARLPNLALFSISDETYVGRGHESSAELGVAQLPLLKSLRFDRMLPAASACTSLEQLDIVKTYLSQIPDDFGERLPCLRELTFRQYVSSHSLRDHVTSLPLASLPLLESLTLSECNHLFTLPEDLGCLLALKTLVLHKLPLEGLPDSLCQLAALETFLLIECASHPNDLQLPAAFCSLTALETLGIVKMPRVTLPENIGELPRLRTVFLNGLYQQRRLPPSFTQLPSLTRLELGMCMLRELPEDMGALTSLQELHIHSCPLLQKLPESLTNLSSLETLMVDDCVKLSSVPRKLDSLGKLKWLELTGCMDQTEPPTFLPPSLEILSLGNSYHVADLLDVSLLPKLRKLCLKLVGAEERMAVTSSFPQLKHLELHLQDDAEELPFPLALLPRLHSLVIWSAAKLQRLPGDMGWALQQLRKLQVHCAGELRELPESIGALSRLRQLYLFDCPALQHLPGSLTQLACLRELQVERTALRCLPPAFAQLGRLRSLRLDGSLQLQVLPEDLADLKMLQFLSLRDCPRSRLLGWI
ncbi:hypothetical protein CLOM_g8960 [Closterium sp. NIES-68]|nr:hypothetical protein CLOM_g8960 [Closterium sp. NIES-68]GJP84826.1 hypothetical protein CLOP_g14876 [Closterium sp. NIES-67]